MIIDIRSLGSKLAGLVGVGGGEKQTAALGWQEPSHPATGLSITKTLAILKDSENGKLEGIAQLFEDMEERDPHLLAEIGKRRMAVTNLDDYVLKPPADATAAESSATEAVQSMWNSLSKRENLIYQLADAIGKGLACVEIDWQLLDGLYTPSGFDLKPLSWFELTGDNRDRVALVIDGEAQELWPFGWVTHWHNPRSGYNSRNALYRALVLPYLLKNYSLQDWAEYNERYGMPIRVGKYDNAATSKQKETLRRAITHVGRTAGATIPKSMQIELLQLSKTTHTSYLEFIQYVDKLISKCILGGTLTSDNAQTGSYSLGQVHEEIRKDIYRSDVRQIAATLNEQILHPLIALNFPQLKAGRYPRLVSNVRESADMEKFSTALERLQRSGLKVKTSWVYDQLNIPQPGKGDDVLESDSSAVAATRRTAALAGERSDQLDMLTAHLDKQTEAAFDGMLQPVRDALELSDSLEEFAEAIAGLSAELDDATLIEQVQKATAVATLAGMYDEAQRG